MTSRLLPIVFLALLVAAPLHASPQARSTASARCRSAIPWQEARQVAGMVAEVKGPVVGTRYARSRTGRPTFLDLGNAFPDPNRFTAVIAGRNRGRFGMPERRYRGRTICVIGRVTLVRGVPQTDVTTPSQIRVVK
jgi:hypothetical protein